jgi:hypothetical protein
VTFSKTGTATLSKSGVASTETFCNLIINDGTTLDTTDDFAAVSGGAGCGTLTISGTQTSSGILRRQAPAQNINALNTPFTFNDALNNPSVIITQTAGTLMGNTPVTISARQTSWLCGSTSLGGLPVRRYFDISPANTSGVTATVRLYWATGSNDETNSNNVNDVRIYHCNPATSTWTRLTGSYTYGSVVSGGITYRYVELLGVTTFSPFVIGGGPGAPTAVTLSSFSAQAAGTDGGVILTWIIASQVNTAGFNIYRSARAEGPYIRINTLLIPALGDALLGGKYRYHDTRVAPGKTYYYQLEDVELNGTSMRHDPIQIAIPTASETNVNFGLLIGLSVAALAAAGVARAMLKKKQAA